MANPAASWQNGLRPSLKSEDVTSVLGGILASLFASASSLFSVLPLLLQWNGFGRYFLLCFLVFFLYSGYSKACPLLFGCSHNYSANNGQLALGGPD